MAEFPASPVAPADFFRDYLPAAFAAADLPEAARGADMALGVKLLGGAGGEWVVYVENGALRVEAESRAETSFTYVQTVEDWRGALWEGRGGAVGKQAGLLFRPGDRPVATTGGMGGPPSPAALEQLRTLDGVIRMVVSGGAGGDWSVDFKLGPGEIPAEPTTTVTVSDEDAAAMESGALNPMEAFMAGRIRVAGDMTLMMQMQAIQMQALASQRS